MKVKYIGKTDFPYLKHGEVYSVMSIEEDLYRIYCELCNEDYLFSMGRFEIIDDSDREEITLTRAQLVEIGKKHLLERNINLDEDDESAPIVEENLKVWV